MLRESDGIFHHSGIQAAMGSKEYEHLHSKQVHLLISYSINQDIHKSMYRYKTNSFIHLINIYLVSPMYKSLC